MLFPANSRLCLFGVIALVQAALPDAHALLNIDGTRNQIFFFGNMTFNYSTNIFSDATGRGDYKISSGAGIELKRRAGIITVNATGKLDYDQYGKYKQENSINPSFNIQLNKTTGRTTGTITVNAARESRADGDVNLRTNSWNFPLGLNIRYPINEKAYTTSQTNYLQRTYNNLTLPNFTEYAEGLDLFYVYSSKLDLLGGYRIRVSKTSIGGNSSDQSLSFGATGGLLAKLTGTVRFGYQLRSNSGSVDSGNYAQINGSSALSWPITRRLLFQIQLSRDFNTIATGATSDSTSSALRANFAFTRKLQYSAGVAYSRNLYLSNNLDSRKDGSFSFDLRTEYKLNEHMSFSVSYDNFRNWSTLSSAEFSRQGMTLSVTSRY